jgi:O-antigen ligase
MALLVMPSFSVKLALGHSLAPNPLELVLLPGIVLAALAVAAGLPARRWPLTWPALALLAVGLLAILWSPDRRYAAGIYRTNLVEPIAAAYALHLLLDRPRKIWLVAGALVASGLVSAVGELYTAFHQLQAGIRFDLHPPAGLYDNANMAALFLVPAVCVAAGLAFKGEPLPRPVAVASVIVLLAGLLATYSRGGFLGAAAAAIVIWLLAVQRWRWQMAAGALAAATAIALLAPGLLLRIGHVLNPTDPANTLVSRSVIWAAAIAMLRNHPILGIGLADFQVQLHSYAPLLHETHTHPHNLILNLWLNLGIPGLIAYLAALVVLVAAVVRGLRLGRRTEFYFLFCAAAAILADILVHGMVDNVIWSNDLSLQFWTLVALVTAALRWHDRIATRF